MPNSSPLPENDYQLLRLTEEFYKRYPNPPYKEMLKKRGRAYNCLLFQTHYEYFICIPYRSEIRHPYSFRFKKSKRSLEHKSGLDYSKIVIVYETKYIGTKDAIIDQDEYRETMFNFERIKAEALSFVEDYVEYLTRGENISKEEFRRRYAYSTLQYFHKELGIEKNDSLVGRNFWLI